MVNTRESPLLRYFNLKRILFGFYWLLMVMIKLIVKLLRVVLLLKWVLLEFMIGSLIFQALFKDYKALAFVIWVITLVFVIFSLNTLRLKSRIDEWKEILQYHGLEKYAKNFVDNNLKTSQINEIKERHIHLLGINNVNDIIWMEAAIKSIQDQQNK